MYVWPVDCDVNLTCQETLCLTQMLTIGLTCNLLILMTSPFLQIHVFVVYTEMTIVLFFKTLKNRFQKVACSGPQNIIAI